MARRLKTLAETPVTRLEGVGEKRAEALGKLDIESVLDLLTYYPRRWIDRTNERRIDELDVGEEAMVLATVKGVTARRTRTRKSMVVVDLTDGSGFLRATFFNQPFRERQLRAGMSTVLFG
ncbi:MAG: ATP-dependent DNA helicase RecG, partial [Acidimicrobiales bacterium]